MLVLKWFLASLKSQFYLGSTPGGDGLKKPLNAFLGEIFIGSWTQEVEMRGRSRSRGQSLSMPGPNGGVLDANGWEQPRGFVRKATTRLVAEQVSHHPPVTAVYMEDDEHGIRGEGYARVEMVYARPTSIEIRQVGHAVLQIDRFDEAYLIPLPDARVDDILHANPYPDIDGTYRIASSSGYISEIDFTGGKERHTFQARVCNAEETEEGKEPTSLYTVSGKWSDSFVIRDCRTDRVVEKYDTNAYYHTPADLKLPPPEEQDPWEAHKAWRAVMAAIRNDDYTAIMEEKSRLEEAQRDMRRREKESGRGGSRCCSDHPWPRMEMTKSLTPGSRHSTRTGTGRRRQRKRGACGRRIWTGSRL